MCISIIKVAMHTKKTVTIIYDMPTAGTYKTE